MKNGTTVEVDVEKVLVQTSLRQNEDFALTFVDPDAIVLEDGSARLQEVPVSATAHHPKSVWKMLSGLLVSLHASPNVDSLTIVFAI